MPIDRGYVPKTKFYSEGRTTGGIGYTGPVLCEECGEELPAILEVEDLELEDTPNTCRACAGSKFC